MVSPTSPISKSEDAASQKYEDKVLNDLFAELLEVVAEVIKDVVKAEATDVEDLTDTIISIVSRLKPKVSLTKISRAVYEGLQLGIINSGAYEDSVIPEVTTADVKATIKLLGSYDKPLKDSVRKAIQVTKADPEDLDAVLAAVKAVQIKAEQLSNYIAGTAQAQGVKLVAKENNGKIMWVHEQGACLHCLAYTGQVIDRDATFPISTFADKPLKFATDLTGPPLHPHCRCRLRIWDGPKPRSPEDIPRNNNNTTFAEALQREARRAVLRGDSDYDSLISRLKAADKLLSIGANLPPTVEKRAARAIKNKNFSRVGKS